MSHDLRRTSARPPQGNPACAEVRANRSWRSWSSDSSPSTWASECSRRGPSGTERAAIGFAATSIARAKSGQRLSDTDQTLSNRDQTLSDHDQQSSDLEQAASDWNSAHGGHREAHRRASLARAATTNERSEGSGLRDRTARERDVVARQRDQRAALRDQRAQAQDAEAAHLDGQEDLSDRHTLRIDHLRARARAARIRAVSDRAQAARDREQAALDRQQAARDRERAAHELDCAGTDDLTGARRRGVGLEELENEINRARRDHKPLVAAYVDVDGLKALNDERGHAAGDALLRDVADRLRAHVRPYDLLVRMGGDEFLCALPASSPEVEQRFAAFLKDLNGSAGASVSVGFSELRAGDLAREFVSRADEDLLARRNGALGSPAHRLRR